MHIRKRMIGLLCCLLCPMVGLGQDQIWVKVDAGQALILDGHHAEWVPLLDRQSVPVKAFLLTKPDTQVQLFKETEVINVPTDAYFYIQDALPKQQTAVVAALTRIQAEQLPASPQRRSPKRVLGLTYGTPENHTDETAKVPYERERYGAVQWFYEQGRHDAALLSLKRMMTKFPSLYKHRPYVDQLLELYSQLELYGFLHDESRQLMQFNISDDFDQMVIEWNDLAKQKLLQ